MPILWIWPVVFIVGKFPVILAVPIFYFLFPFLDKHFGSKSLKHALIRTSCVMGVIGVLAILTIVWER